MTNVVILSASLILLSAASCERYEPPKTELCIAGDQALFLCNDPRRNEGERDYDLVYPEDTLNYLCTNPADYAKLKDYCTDLRTKLINCEKSVKSSKD